MSVPPSSRLEQNQENVEYTTAYNRGIGFSELRTIMIGHRG